MPGLVPIHIFTLRNSETWMVGTARDNPEKSGIAAGRH